MTQLYYSIDVPIFIEHFPGVEILHGLGSGLVDSCEIGIRTRGQTEGQLSLDLCEDMISVEPLFWCKVGDIHNLQRSRDQRDNSKSGSDVSINACLNGLTIDTTKMVPISFNE